VKIIVKSILQCLGVGPAEIYLIETDADDTFKCSFCQDEIIVGCRATYLPEGTRGTVSHTKPVIHCQGCLTAYSDSGRNTDSLDWTEIYELLDAYRCPQGRPCQAAHLTSGVR
jgi:hypothetical protein